jgi:hypothetical protein
MRKLLVGVLLLAALAAAALLTGLADPLVRWRVESALLASGVSERRAECMAERMVDRLTVWQLYRLQSGMAARPGEPEEGYGLGELIKRLRRVEDGEAVAVVTTSAALCAVGIG